VAFLTLTTQKACCLQCCVLQEKSNRHAVVITLVYINQINTSKTVTMYFPKILYCI